VAAAAAHSLPAATRSRRHLMWLLRWRQLLQRALALGQSLAFMQKRAKQRCATGLAAPLLAPAALQRTTPAQAPAAARRRYLPLRLATQALALLLMRLRCRRTASSRLLLSCQPPRRAVHRDRTGRQ
jgi:hypothetical protein